MSGAGAAGVCAKAVVARTTPRTVAPSVFMMTLLLEGKGIVDLLLLSQHLIRVRRRDGPEIFILAPAVRVELRVDVDLLLRQPQRQLLFLVLLALVEHRAHAAEHFSVTRRRGRGGCRANRRRLRAHLGTKIVLQRGELGAPRRGVLGRRRGGWYRLRPAGRDGQARGAVVTDIEIRNRRRHAEHEYRPGDLRPDRHLLPPRSRLGARGSQLAGQAESALRQWRRPFRKRRTDGSEIGELASTDETCVDVRFKGDAFGRVDVVVQIGDDDRFAIRVNASHLIHWLLLASSRRSTARP